MAKKMEPTNRLEDGLFKIPQGKEETWKITATLSSEAMRAIPREYQDLAEVFSEKNLDELPPH